MNSRRQGTTKHGINLHNILTSYEFYVLRAELSTRQMTATTLYVTADICMKVTIFFG